MGQFVFLRMYLSVLMSVDVNNTDGIYTCSKRRLISSFRSQNLDKTEKMYRNGRIKISFRKNGLLT